VHTIFSVAMTVFKYSAGVFIGCLLLGLMIFLLFVVFGLLLSLLKSKKSRNENKIATEKLDKLIQEIGTPKPTITHVPR